MAALLARVTTIIGLLALLMLTAAPPASAQSVNPTANSVKEEQLLNALRGGDTISGRVSIPDAKSGTLIQPEGQGWRSFHEGALRWIGALSILGVLAAIIVFYLTRGQVKIEGGRSGRTITRFNGFERFVHWMTATCFIILAISGLNITFGKSLLLPIMSAEAFTAWSQWGKYAHNYLSFPFTIGVVLIFLMWIAGNIPNKVDVEWVKRGGGLFGDDHPPAQRFNAGQKFMYWVVVIGGGAVAITGYLLMFPFYGTTIAGLQLAAIIHGIVAVLFVAAMIAHIYIGTIGMEGAFEAMGTGEVDVNWAREHHALWLEEQNRQRAAGEPRASAAPAE